MSESNMLKEFLVGLGFKIDQQGNKEFQKATDDATESVEALGAATDKTAKKQDEAGRKDRERAKQRKKESDQERKEQQKREEQRKKDLQAFADAAMVMAATTAAAMAKVAKDMDQMFFQHLRTGSAVSSLEAIGYAGKQMGVDLNAALLTFTQNLATMPGLVQKLNAMGIKTKGVDPADIMAKLGESFKAMPEYQAIAQGGAFGLDAQTVMAMRREDMAGWMNRDKDMAKAMGVDLDESAKNLHEFATQLRDTLEAVKIFTVGVLGEAAKYINDPKGLGKDIARLLGAMGVTEAKDALRDEEPDFVPGPEKGATRGDRNNNPGNIKYGPFAKRHGATGQDKDGFAIFPDRDTGSAASRALLHSYAAEGINTISKIAAKWNKGDPDGATLFTRLATQLTGLRPDQFVNLSNPEMLRRIEAARERTEGTYHPAAPELENRMQSIQNNSGGNVTFNQVNHNRFDSDSPTLARDVSQASAVGVNTVLMNGRAGAQ